LLVSGALVKVSDVTPEAADGYFINAVDSSNALAKEFVDWLQCFVNTDLT
jgi:hypothetical protein